MVLLHICSTVQSSAHASFPAFNRGRGNYFGRCRGGRFHPGRDTSMVRCQFCNKTIRYQLCNKTGHEALECWFHFDLVLQSQYAPPPSFTGMNPAPTSYAPASYAPPHAQRRHSRHYGANAPPMSNLGYHQPSILGPTPVSHVQSC
ncbi:hypothetical protein Lalb_Chr10g0093971 [Lupinus albus]|uniref:Uncharacterized protein n=1 Tax=Lupinus albus TaxID=3870 RepID=A0A6A4PU02_LUPAL|nr:hypothetical protein Lalb_Chr10g0093971 [Lupinus albus]